MGEDNVKVDIAVLALSVVRLAATHRILEEELLPELAKGHKTLYADVATLSESTAEITHRLHNLEKRLNAQGSSMK